MTPRELMVYVNEYTEKTEYEVERRQHEMYVCALLISRFVWVKRVPPYEKIFRKSRHTVMSDGQMLEMAEVLNLMFGGTDIRKEAD